MAILKTGGGRMANRKPDANDRINVELGGMGLYGTTSNMEVGGYEMSGDIENAGRLDKGFKRAEGHHGAQASLKEDERQDGDY